MVDTHIRMPIGSVVYSYLERFSKSERKILFSFFYCYFLDNFYGKRFTVFKRRGNIFIFIWIVGRQVFIFVILNFFNWTYFQGYLYNDLAS